ncbi:MAG: hypothetical protein TUN42_10205 [Dehalogenimonas sp.]
MPELDFPWEIREFVYKRAEAKCECAAGCAIHLGKRCDTVFWRTSAANYHALNPKGLPTSSNCIMMCNYCLRQATKDGK